jgi:hypothetical protein
MKISLLLLPLLVPKLYAGADLLTTGLPRGTTYAELVILMSQLYNEGNCAGSYKLVSSDVTVNNLVSVTTQIICNGQNFTIFGAGNGLDVKFPVKENNYTGIDMNTLQACGRTFGCFNLTYTGSDMPVYVGCTAFAQRSTGSPITNCTSCTPCTTGEAYIKMTTDCANVNSEFTTATACTAPFTTGSSVMGVTPATGGGTGGGGTSSSPISAEGRMSHVVSAAVVFWSAYTCGYL